MAASKYGGTKNCNKNNTIPAYRRSWASHNSRRAGNAHQYEPKNGAADKIAAKAEGKKTMRAPNTVWTSHVNNPVNSEHLNIEIKTPDIEFSKASAIFEPDVENPMYFVTCSGAYFV